MKYGVLLLGVVGLTVVGVYASRLPGAGRFRRVVPKNSAPTPVVVLTKPDETPWTPSKNDLPPDFVEAVRFFRTHGLGDPRRGKFSHVWSGNVLTEEGQLVQPVMWFGWAEKLGNGTTRFAADDGLTYDLSVNTQVEDLQSFMRAPEDHFRADGVVRSLDADRTIFLTADNSPGKRQSRDAATDLPVLASWQFPPGQDRDGERHALSFEMLAALCLIEGRADLSKILLAKHRDSSEPYMQVLALTLLKTKLIRALDAYSRGEDRTALELFEDVQSSRAAFEIEVDKAAGAGLKDRNWASFLDQVPALIEETERRLGEGAGVEEGLPTNRSPLPPSFGTSLPIEDSGQARPKQGGFPEGGPDWEVWALENFGLSNGMGVARESAAMARYRAVPANLYRMGPEVVGPMIEVAGSDSRFSRQIVRSGNTLRVVSVREIALRIINAITGASFHLDPSGRGPTQLKLSNWWQANSALAAGEREFSFLADESGDSLQWVAAAEQLAGYRPVQFGASPVEQAWARLRARRHANPSVSELMVRRMNQFLTKPAGGSDEIAAKLMYRCLHRWDPRYGAGPLDALTNHLMEVDAHAEVAKLIPHVDSTGQSYSRTDPDLTSLLEQRISAGDSSVTPVYRRLLLRLTRGEDRVNSTGFMFLYEHRNAPGLAGLAKQLFLDPLRTGQTVKLTPDQRYQPLAFTVMWSPLLNLPDEQDAVIRLLKDKSVIGKATKRQSIATVVSGGNYSFIPAFGNGMRYLADGTTWHLRVCDEVASRMLRSSENSNSFHDYWPPARKDAIIGELIAKLRVHPSNLWPQTGLWI